MVETWPKRADCQEDTAAIRAFRARFDKLRVHETEEYGYTGDWLDVQRYITKEPPLGHLEIHRSDMTLMVVLDASQDAADSIDSFKRAMVSLGEVVSEFVDYGFSIYGFSSGKYWEFKGPSANWSIARSRICALEGAGPSFSYDYGPLLPEISQQKPDLCVTISAANPPEAEPTPTLPNWRKAISRTALLKLDDGKSTAEDTRSRSFDLIRTIAKVNLDLVLPRDILSLIK